MPDNIFPILDRRAPILERIRDDENNDEMGKLVAKTISESVKTDDDELLEETRQQIVDNLTVDLADNFGVEPEDISNSYVDNLTDVLIGSNESDVLTDEAMENLGMKVADDTDDDEEKEEDTSLF